MCLLNYFMPKWDNLFQLTRSGQKSNFLTFTTMKWRTQVVLYCHQVCVFNKDIISHLLNSIWECKQALVDMPYVDVKNITSIFKCCKSSNMCLKDLCQRDTRFWHILYNSTCEQSREKEATYYPCEQKCHELKNPFRAAALLPSVHVQRMNQNVYMIVLYLHPTIISWRRSNLISKWAEELKFYFEVLHRYQVCIQIEILLTFYIHIIESTY